MDKNRITLPDILKGTIFSIVLLILGVYLNQALKIGTFEAFSLIISYVKNKYVLGGILIISVIIGAFCSAVATSVEWGLPLHKYLKTKKDKDS